MQVSLDTFKDTIKSCRTRETSGHPEQRSDKNPSYRQCLVTALLANEMLGFSVYAEELILHDTKEYHYFNKNEKDISYRFCEEQFAHEKVLARKEARLLNKDQVNVLLERHPETKIKYEILKNKFQNQIQSSLKKI